MKLPHRRHFLHLAAGVAAPALSRTAWAQIYPTRLVRLIVGFGGSEAVKLRTSKYFATRPTYPLRAISRRASFRRVAGLM